MTPPGDIRLFFTLGGGADSQSAAWDEPAVLSVAKTPRGLVGTHGLAKRLRNHRGQALVEFALVALLLVMLLVGIVDVSRLILTYTTIANAARAGTRYAIVHGSDNSSPCNVTTYIKGYLSAASMNIAHPPLTIAAPACGSAAGTIITTTVTYTYTPLITYFFPTSISLSSTSEGVVVF
jgi:hypothetical protein